MCRYVKRDCNAWMFSRMYCYLCMYVEWLFFLIEVVLKQFANQLIGIKSVNVNFKSLILACPVYCSNFNLIIDNLHCSTVNILPYYTSLSPLFLGDKCMQCNLCKQYYWLFIFYFTFKYWCWYWPQKSSICLLWWRIMWETWTLSDFLVFSRWSIWYFRRPWRFKGSGDFLPGERRSEGRVRWLIRP